MRLPGLVNKHNCAILLRLYIYSGFFFCEISAKKYLYALKSMET